MWQSPVVSGGLAWIPASSFRTPVTGIWNSVGSQADIWSTTPHNTTVCLFYFTTVGVYAPGPAAGRADGCPVRCIRE